VEAQLCAWWHTPIIPAVGRWRKEDLEFEASVGCLIRPCLKEERKKERKSLNYMLVSPLYKDTKENLPEL
jgi:hypothetical protein